LGKIAEWENCRIKYIWEQRKCGENSGKKEKILDKYILVKSHFADVERLLIKQS
jgi:hypothetical protein